MGQFIEFFNIPNSYHPNHSLTYLQVLVWGGVAHAYPYETNYLSIPSGWFHHKSETNVLGYCLRLSLTGPLFKNRLVSCSGEQTKETTIG